MKRISVISIILLMAMSSTATICAESLSTANTIKLTLKVMAKSEIKDNGKAINVDSVDEKNRLEAYPVFNSKALQRRKNNPFFEIIKTVKNFFQPK